MFDERFTGWLATDFDAYVERKWRSNRFNLERGRVRMRLLDLLRRAAESAEVDTEGFELWSSYDHPSFFNGHVVRAQRVAWCRTSDERERLTRADHTVEAQRVDRCHVHLGVHVDETGLALLLSLPPEARFDLSLLASAQETLVAGAAAVAAPWAEAGEDGWRVELRIGHAAAEADEALATDAVAAWLRALWPSLQALTWSDDRDPDGLSAMVQAADDAHTRAAVGAVTAAAAPAPERPKQAARPAVPWRARPNRPILAAAGTGVAARDEEAEREAAERRAMRDRAMALLRERPQGDGHAPSASASQPVGRGPVPGQGANQQSGGGPDAAPDQRRGPNQGRGADRGPQPDHSRGPDRGAGRGPDRGAGRGPDRGAGHGPDRGPDRGPRRGPDRGPDRGRGPDRPVGGGGGRPYEIRPERAEVVGLAVGANVELIAGLFAGKQGVVEAIRRGEAEVRVGAMQLKVRLGDLRPS